jgi:hypothetical protein
MRALFGIAELHSMTASAMQAARRAAVASSWANAAVGIAPMSKPAAASISMGILIMTISLGRYTPPAPDELEFFRCSTCVEHRPLMESVPSVQSPFQPVAAAGQIIAPAARMTRSPSFRATTRKPSCLISFLGRR